MAKELFGTDGIRGIPGEYPLDDQTLYAAGRTLGGYLRNIAARQAPNTSGADGAGPARVLIGMDTRESGRTLQRKWPPGWRTRGRRFHRLES